MPLTQAQDINLLLIPYRAFGFSTKICRRASFPGRPLFQKIQQLDVARLHLGGGLLRDNRHGRRQRFFSRE